jgi:hypothetical protein
MRASDRVLSSKNWDGKSSKESFRKTKEHRSIMTYITADELIPVAHEYGFKHTVSVGLLLGLIFALLIDVILS